MKPVFMILFILFLGFTVSCEDQKVASKTEPIVIAECPSGYHPCADDSSACCPFDIPATMEQTPIDWPSLADTPWPMYMHDPQLTGRSPYEGPALGEYDTLYNQSGEVYSNPIIDPYGNILFTSKTNALNATGVLFSVSLDGQLNWEIELGHSKIFNVGTPVITADDYFYLASSDGESGYLIKGDLSGNIVWKYNFDAPYSYKIKGSPNISKNGALIFICGFGNALYVIKSDGTLGWKYDVSPNNTETVPAISPDGNIIYFFSDDNVLRAINLSGKLIWAKTLSTNSSATRTHP